VHGLRPCGLRGKRRFKVTTDSNHDLPISPNVLNREFTVAEPDKVWVGDITYIATDEGWLFLLSGDEVGRRGTCTRPGAELSSVFHEAAIGMGECASISVHGSFVDRNSI
jgi:transposase InsO family protein